MHPLERQRRQLLKRDKLAERIKNLEKCVPKYSTRKRIAILRKRLQEVESTIQ
jgi:hypothetical protein